VQWAAARIEPNCVEFAYRDKQVLLEQQWNQPSRIVVVLNRTEELARIALRK